MSACLSFRYRKIILSGDVQICPARTHVYVPYIQYTYNKNTNNNNKQTICVLRACVGYKLNSIELIPLRRRCCVQNARAPVSLFGKWFINKEEEEVEVWNGVERAKKLARARDNAEDFIFAYNVWCICDLCILNVHIICLLLCVY